MWGIAGGGGWRLFSQPALTALIFKPVIISRHEINEGERGDSGEPLPAFPLFETKSCLGDDEKDEGKPGGGLAG
ncbi:hypothetical protein AWM70_22480 [Paenibacillus yonginensis]|uniref:Uncharacterized protein n=1 Tax=Paenibacillus yonginensis TaxID=1462996 RepID=A0A1B1N6G1_9BACL|nr:hypothetical protein AWM70_22480 [Paenibacillus yonginensis]